MQVHQIKKPNKIKRKQRVGRGGKRGTYSGRGIKGQKARAGHRIRPQIWDYIFKIPKLSGPTQKREDAGAGSKHKGAVVSEPMFTVNLKDITPVSKSGDVVNVMFLVDKGLVKKYKGRLPRRVKILGDGDIKKKLTLEGVSASKSVEEKVKKAGGSVKK